MAGRDETPPYARRKAGPRRATPRLPATVTDAWTCPDCGRSYWPPAEWEHELWPVLRRAAQTLHGRRHGRLPDPAQPATSPPQQ